MSQIECLVCGKKFPSYSTFRRNTHDCFAIWGESLLDDQHGQESLDAAAEDIKRSEASDYARRCEVWERRYGIGDITFAELRRAIGLLPRDLQHTQERALEARVPDVDSKKRRYADDLVAIEILVLRGVPRDLAILVEDLDDLETRRQLIGKFLAPGD